MIGELPQTLLVSGKEYPINTDFRVALIIFEAFEDPELTQAEMTAAMIGCLFEKPESVPFEDYEEACLQAAWFLDGGKDYESEKSSEARVLSWEQDEQMIFAAVNKAAGYELRTCDYIHWWTFLGYFSEIGECLLNTVVSIRKKKNQQKSLDKFEQEFYKKNKNLIDIKKKYSAAEQAERDMINALLG